MFLPASGGAQNCVGFVRETLGLTKAEVCRRAPVRKRELELMRGHEPRRAIARRLVRLFNANGMETVSPTRRAAPNHDLPGRSRRGAEILDAAAAGLLTVQNEAGPGRRSGADGKGV